VIGISIADLHRMSMWEFHAMVEGWNKAQSSGEEKPPEWTPEAFDEFMSRP